MRKPITPKLFVPRPTPHKLAVVALSCVAVLALVGCGSNGSSAKKSSSSGSSGAAPVSLSGKVNAKGSKDISSAGSSATLEIEADDFYFKPTYVKAAAGQSVTVNLKNDGSAQHTFTIDALGVDQTLDPGAKASVKVKVPQTGASEFHCRFHQSMGMQGALYVTPGGTAGGSTSSRSSSGY